MPVILKNNAFSTLATAITTSDTGIVVASGGAFPALSAGEYFYVTLVSQAGTTEIIKVTARVGNSMTVVRAQDGSTAASFQVGTLVEMRVNVASVLDSNVDYTTFDTVTLLLADTTLVYTKVSVGDIVQTRSEGFAYSVAASGATNHHVTTAGGVKLYVQPGSSGYDVKAFGAKGDNSTSDTAAIQKAFDVVGIVNNTGSLVAGSPTPEIYLSAGTYIVEKVVLAPGTLLRGAGRDASVLKASSGHADTILEVKRPASILSSRTRNYTIEQLTVLGDLTAGQVGIDIYQIAEVIFRDVNIGRCDYGVIGYDVVTGKFDRCKIYGNVTRGMFLRNGCNAIEISNTRIQATTAGANVEIDGQLTGVGLPGSFITYNVTFVNAIIESAIHATLGVGVLIGPTNSATAIQFFGCYFEANKVSAIDVGSATATATSVVTVVGGNFASSGNAGAYGIRNYGGSLSVNNAWLDGIPTAANRLLMEANGAGSVPRLLNMTNYSPTGTFEYDAVEAGGFGTGPGQIFQTGAVNFADGAADFGRFIKRASDVAFQGTGKYLWLQTEVRTSWQGTGLLSSGVLNVTFGTAAANANYAVTIGSEGNNHIKISSKTVNGFTVSAVDGTGAVQTGDVSRVHWHVFRNQ